MTAGFFGHMALGGALALREGFSVVAPSTTGESGGKYTNHTSHAFDPCLQFHYRNLQSQLLLSYLKPFLKTVSGYI
jgi:hypothetical protein